MKPMLMSGPDVRYLESKTTGLQIPVVASRGLVFSPWVPSKEDIIAFEKGEPLWLVQRGDAIPEMHMIVGKRHEVVPPEIKREAIKVKDPLIQREIKIELAARKWGPLVGWGLVTGVGIIFIAVLKFLVAHR